MPVCAKAPRTAEEKNHTQDVPHAGKDHTWFRYDLHGFPRDYIEQCDCHTLLENRGTWNHKDSVVNKTEKPQHPRRKRIDSFQVAQILMSFRILWCSPDHLPFWRPSLVPCLRYLSQRPGHRWHSITRSPCRHKATKITRKTIGYHRIPSACWCATCLWTVAWAREDREDREAQHFWIEIESDRIGSTTRQLDSISNNMLHTKGRRVSKNLKLGSRCDRRISAMPKVLILVHTWPLTQVLTRQRGWRSEVLEASGGSQMHLLEMFVEVAMCVKSITAGLPTSADP